MPLSYVRDSHPSFNSDLSNSSKSAALCSTIIWLGIAGRVGYAIRLPRLFGPQTSPGKARIAAHQHFATSQHGKDARANPWVDRKVLYDTAAETGVGDNPISCPLVAAE